MSTKDELEKFFGRGVGPFDLTKGAAPFGALRTNQAVLERTGVSEVRSREVPGDRFGATGEARTYRIGLGGRLAVTLEGPKGEDFDIYVKQGSPPTVEDYDLVGYAMRANQKMVIESPESGGCYLMVRAYRGAGDFSLRVDPD